VRDAVARCAQTDGAPASATDRERCVRQIQEQLVTIEASTATPAVAEPAPPPPSSSPGVVVASVVTVAVLIAIATRIAKRVRARNLAAFLRSLGELERSGFAEGPAPDLREFVSFSDYAVDHALVRNGPDGELWLLELEHPEGPQYERWPVRAALFDVDLGPARGRIQRRSRRRAPVAGDPLDVSLRCDITPTDVGDLVLAAVGADLLDHWPGLALQLQPGKAIVYTIEDRRAPLALIDVATVAERIRVGLQGDPVAPGGSTSDA
jgi:hypothetical protein